MKSVVYYARTDDGESAASVTEKLRGLIKKSAIFKPIGKEDYAGVKLHFGEEGNTGHIRAGYVREVVRLLHETATAHVFLTDSNVLYKGSRRTNAVDHLLIAREHGYDIATMGAPVIIADGLHGRSYVEIPIRKKHFKKAKIAPEIAAADTLVVMTHATGHLLTGFAGALKNLGMGCASRKGKFEQHSGSVPEMREEYCIGCGMCVTHCPASCIKLVAKKARIQREKCIGCGECIVVCRTKALETRWSERLENLQEKMVEYAYGTVAALKKKPCYITFLLKVTKDCDCLAKDEPAIVPDTGILASDDPVAIDKAAADLLNERGRQDIFRKEFPGVDWTVQMRYAERIGLGNLDYKIVAV
ncbi:MAG: DUF362 domain-containing protein [Candidatus Omnitrophica bacterium]|nr:DUF362 domain-containing protein [Candidatus Omnitrophota bacterium]